MFEQSWAGKYGNWQCAGIFCWILALHILPRFPVNRTLKTAFGAEKRDSVDTKSMLAVQFWFYRSRNPFRTDCTFCVELRTEHIRLGVLTITTSRVLQFGLFWHRCVRPRVIFLRIACINCEINYTASNWRSKPADRNDTRSVLVSQCTFRIFYDCSS